jgi:hypothetical protein
MQNSFIVKPLTRYLSMMERKTGLVMGILVLICVFEDKEQKKNKRLQ